MWTKEQFKRETDYRAAMAIARKMLALSIITREDYRVIDTKMAAIFLPITRTLSP